MNISIYGRILESTKLDVGASLDQFIHLNIANRCLYTIEYLLQLMNND